MRHGEQETGGVRGRWCAVCEKKHGALYVCEHYPERLRVQLVAEGDQERAMVWDEEWAATQDPMTVAILRAFAGPPLEETT